MKSTYSAFPLQVVNDYERDVFNGDQGFVTGVSPDGGLEISFPPATSGGSKGAAAASNGGAGGGVTAAGNGGGSSGSAAANQVAGSQAAGSAAAGGRVPPPRRTVQYHGRQVLPVTAWSKGFLHLRQFA